MVAPAVDVAQRISRFVNDSPTAPLYAALPYPADGIIRTTVARILARGVRKLAPALEHKADLTIADFGCGTGECTAGIAKFFPHAQVVGVDVNPPSLALASALAQRHKLNIRFLQCDITDRLFETLEQHQLLPDGRKFDIVVSSGVLHSVGNPKAGFAEVRRTVQPQGLFQCYMYTKFGRWAVSAARELLDSVWPAAAREDRQQAVDALRLSQREGLLARARQARHRLQFGPPLRPFEMLNVYLNRKRAAHVGDVFSNPCESFYSFAELNRLFTETGWTFVSLAERGGLPVTPEDHTRDPRALAVLKKLPPNTLYDYFAYRYQAPGFTMFLRPA